MGRPQRSHSSSNGRRGRFSTTERETLLGPAVPTTVGALHQRPYVSAAQRGIQTWIGFSAPTGTRTHDLLHGKRVVGSAHLSLEAAWLWGFSRLPTSQRPLENMPICGRFQPVWA